jgi:hypothetical protein
MDGSPGVDLIARHHLAGGTQEPAGGRLHHPRPRGSRGRCGASL